MATSKDNDLIVLHLALEAAALTITQVRKLPADLKDLRKQGIRSASSVPLNISEGRGRFGGDRKYHYSVAYGSAGETMTLLELIAMVGAVDVQRCREAVDGFDQVRAILWRWMHPSN